MKVEYTELIVFKSGITTLMTKTFDVIGSHEGYAHLRDKEDNRFWVSEERVNGGPEQGQMMLGHGKVPIDIIDYCLSEVKEIKE